MSSIGGSRALPRLFQRLVVGIALAASPTAVAHADVNAEDEQLDEVDRAIHVVLGSMVDRALEHKRDLSEVLAILLANMHPLDATRSICEAALSPSVEVRIVLCNALARDPRIVGRVSVLEHLLHDANGDVHHAAARALRST
jgi:hypothetical protein